MDRRPERLLAHVVVSKYVDHLPLHRLEGIFAREGMAGAWPDDRL
jgi:transposase